MSFWTAIVIIAAIWGVASVIRARHNAETSNDTDYDGKAGGNPRRERELQAEITQLRERLEVLERIATDDRGSKQLSAEIESLRRRD